MCVTPVLPSLLLPEFLSLRKVAMFYSLRPDGQFDDFSLHGACPVITGEGERGRERAAVFLAGVLAINSVWFVGSERVTYFSRFAVFFIFEHILCIVEM